MRLVVFDLDGTLVEFNIPVERIKSLLGIRGSILEEIMRSENAPEMLQILERHEVESARNSRLYPGVREFLELLGEHGVVTALYTRNSWKSVRINLKKHRLSFDYVFTREDDVKPSPLPVLHLMEEVNAGRNDTAMVGDYLFDYQTARNAGIQFWMHVNERNRDFLDRFSIRPDLTFSSFYELSGIVRRMLNGSR
ncbi:HAD family hydrolase [Geoglobus ahangari]|uniref:HAD family hydrolase n=1 Tax=Geoglobus ahangari TaxID=113653 RepID=UPI0006994E51|nr:HAD family hydrolase [Geoglobus ahangari]